MRKLSMEKLGETLERKEKKMVEQPQEKGQVDRKPLCI